MFSILALVVLLGHSWSTAAAQPSPQQFEPFVGTWERRDASLFVFDNGIARFRWKVGACRSDTDPGPCDAIINGRLFMGGLIEFVLTDVNQGAPANAVGRVTATTNAAMFAQGAPVNFVRMDESLILLDQPGTSRVWLCRPPRDPNSCDAP